MARDTELTIEEARMIFRNFSGKAGRFNEAGDRNFCILLPDELAEQMRADGWNIKTLRPREEGDVPQPYIEVSVSYKNKPPRIILITGRGRNPIDEKLVDMVDMVDIEQVDVTLNGYNWEVNGNSGRKAYLKTAYITIREDPLDIKYAGYDEADPLDSGVAE